MDQVEIWQQGLARYKNIGQHLVLLRECILLEITQ